MNRLQKLSLLPMALLLAACNEKVSPELQDAASSSTVSNQTTPSEYYFAVENTSSSVLNYKLHETGNGNYNADCKISKTVPLSSSLYKDGADPESDISCYFDVDELALNFSGLSFDVKSSSNTCEYVGYSPFSYFNRMPGDSSTNLYEIVCDAASGVTAAGILDATDGSEPTRDINLGAGALTTAGGFPVICGSIVDRSIPGAVRAPFTITSDTELCRYNYTDGGNEQCDEGIINITSVAVTYDSASNEFSATKTNRQIKCGGKAYNCIRGPIKTLHSKSTNFRELNSTTTNTAFAKTYTLSPLIANEFPGNWEYVNFRRNLASLNIDYGDSNGYDPTTYVDQFGGFEDYTSMLMDRYSNNKKMDATDLIATGAYNTAGSYEYYSYERDSSGNLLYKRRPLAAEPFLGMVNPDNGRSYRTQPFYVFYCLDGAYDIKARIRVVVRDWDRVFPTTNTLELISDVNLLTNARQDVLSMEEIPDDGDSINWFNDFADWDDFVQMERTSGVYDSSTTEWRPSTSVDNSNYPDGFFNPLIFPRYSSQ